jgi:hypothetical protein
MTVPTRQQVDLEFNKQKQAGVNELEKIVNEKWSTLAKKSWKDLGKDAVKAIVTKGAGQVPVVGGGLSWLLDQALTEEPPGQPVAKALTQLAVVREFHAAVLKMLAHGTSVKWNWQTAVRHVAVMDLAVQEAKKQVAAARQAIDRIEHILSVNYHDVAVDRLLERIFEKETPAMELTSLPRPAPLKPLAARR